MNKFPADFLCMLFNPISTGLFYLVVALGGGYSPPSMTFDPDILEHWNLEEIAYIMFYKIR